MKNKNIHILPTDKPSRLIIYSTLLNEFRLLDEPIEDWKHKKNIYITSDEEIKTSDYSLALDTNIVFKVSSKDFPGIEMFKHIYKKIILTTDQDLIKDGVQPIPDEFLEWFVKNPSCEEVKVYYDLFELEKDNTIKKYIIIIPKEEPNTVFVTTEQATRIFGAKKLNKMLKNHKQEIDISKGKLGFDPYDKQETLEEAIERLYGTFEDCKGDEIKTAIRVGRIDAFYDAVKWQQERSYSEEEVLAFGKFCLDKVADFLNGKSEEIDGQEYSMEELLEQFKKK